VPALRHLRRLRGLTQEELAAAAGVSAETISFLERGAREPRPHTMRRIAQALGVRIQDVTEFATERPSAVGESSGRGDGGGATHDPAG
jgi:transcriptional regulator with XRE-family HTH domain